MINSTNAVLNIYSQAASNWTWTVIGGSGTLYPQGASCDVYFTDFVRVQAQTNNRCGGGQSYTFYLLKNGYRSYKIYPNPASNKLTVDFEHKELAEARLYDISLFDDKENLVKRFDVVGAQKVNHFKT